MVISSRHATRAAGLVADPAGTRPRREEITTYNRPYAVVACVFRLSLLVSRRRPTGAARRSARRCRKRSRGACGLPAGPRAARGAKQPAVAAAVATKPWILGCTWPTATFSAVAVLIGPTIVDKTNIDQIARIASAGTC